MTAVHTDTAPDPGTVDWQQGYGYQMWRCRHGGVRADGAFGQFSVVVPEADLVVAVTECTDRAQETLDAIWEVLLPALSEERVRADDGALEALRAHLDGAALPRPDASLARPGEGKWTFAHTPTEEVPGLTGVEVTPADDGWTLRLTEGETVTTVPCAATGWPTLEGRPWVAGGGWTADGVFEAAVCAVETPHVLRLRCADGTATASWNGVPLGRPVLATLTAPGTGSPD